MIARRATVSGEVTIHPTSVLYRIYGDEANTVARSDRPFHARCSPWTAAGEAASCMPRSQWRVGQLPCHRTTPTYSFAPQDCANKTLCRRTYRAMRSSSSTDPTTFCRPSTSTMRSSWKPSQSMTAPASSQHVQRATYTYTSRMGKTQATPRCEEFVGGFGEVADCRSGRYRAASPSQYQRTQ